MRTFSRRASACVLFVLASILWGGHALAQDLPADYSEWSVETGYLTKVKHNSPLDYRVVPTQLVWRSPAAFDLWRHNDGTRLLFRHRVALLVETLPRGAEDYYLGFSGAPSIELWLPNRATAAFFSIGGGAGYINAKGVDGGQGQRFTLNWFTQLGLRHQVSKNVALSGSAYFVHHSNLGMTKPNPGIDALGLNLGLIWRFE
ncbi:MAG: acyloxyacyl hydrolase [Rhodoferax sp.]|nr:acyloxyacyl hydrolase [Rhodoferax sp.]